MAQDKEFFSNLANCYAYAVKCATPLNPGGGQAKPGGYDSSGDEGTNCANYRAGVLADGGGSVNEVGHFAVNALTVANIPHARADWYLIAMLVNKNGFHFVRRQRKRMFGAPFWKWKQANPGLVERNAFDPTSGDWIRVADARFVDLVQNRLVTDPPGYGGWGQVYFFEVHKDGFTVTAS